MKEVLRRKMKAARRSFCGVDRARADKQIADCVLSLLADKSNVLVYNSFGSEADTQEIIQGLISHGKRVFLPRVEGDKMVAVGYTGKEQLIKSSFGIQEPTGKPFEGYIDAAVIPLLAVNRQGMRLGYGGGFYDRYLTAQPSVIRLGTGYSFQMTDEEFADEWDVPLDAFVCERGVFTFSGRR